MITARSVISNYRDKPAVRAIKQSFSVILAQRSGAVLQINSHVWRFAPTQLNRKRSTGPKLWGGRRIDAVVKRWLILITADEDERWSSCSQTVEGSEHGIQSPVCPSESLRYVSASVFICLSLSVCVCVCVCVCWMVIDLLSGLIVPRFSSVSVSPSLFIQLREAFSQFDP